MNYVKCWCCEYCLPYCNESDDEIATCTLTDGQILLFDDVCVDFTLNEGLHTNRIIPDYCKNHKKTPQK